MAKAGATTSKQGKQEKGKGKGKESKGSSKYTDPELREQLKRKIKKGDKGGKPGQWSARKAQLLVRAYEKKGGGYTAPPDEAQQHLREWGEQDWQTAEGDARARTEDGTRRYLPKAAWEELSPAERRATDRRKRDGSRDGQQHVANTDAAAAAGKRARTSTRTGTARQPLPGYESLTVPQVLEALDGADRRRLRRVLDFEHEHRARTTLVRALERRLG